MTAIVETKAPRLTWARSGKKARRQDAVWLTPSGRVAPSWLIRWLPQAQVVSTLLSVGVLAWVVASGLVTINLLFWVPAMVWGNAEIVLMRRYARGLALSLHGRYDEADALLRPIAQSRLLGFFVRGFAGAELARTELARGRRREALATLRLAQTRLSVNGERGEAPLVLARLLETELLIDLDQLQDAARVFNFRQGVEPKGEYLRVAYWTTELYLWMAEGRAVPERGTLDARAKIAVEYETGAPILGLLAWAYQQSGDEERSRELLALARTRDARLPIEVAYPRLHAWMQAQP